MTDPQPPSAGIPPNGGDPGVDQRPNVVPINVLAQYIKDFSFENPNAPTTLMAGQPQPQLQIQVGVQTKPIADGIFEVVLSIRAEATANESMVFLVELAYAALFGLSGIPAEHQRPLLMIEGPRLLFPFARAIIANASRDGGYPPLMINPIDFADLYRRQAERQDAPA